jgi:plasmid maintenance system antidote protein VapI
LNPGAKLTEEQVQEIRSRRYRHFNYELAEMYGVSRQTISNIVTGRAWNHL